MTLGFEDEKGKVFTEVVTKIPIPVKIQTNLHCLHGKVHIRPDERLKAELDRSEPFLALTEAVVLDADGNTLHRADFMAVRRDQIIWVIPEEGEQ